MTMQSTPKGSNMPILDAALSGDRRRTLEAMRDKLAADMDDAPPAVVAQIAGRLSAVMVEIEAINGGKKVTSLDELDERRRNRLSTSDVGVASDRSG